MQTDILSQIENQMTVSFDARAINEGLARMMISAFLSELNPTLDELADVKTAVSEAVTNAIVHGYEMDLEKEEQQIDFPKVQLCCKIKDKEIEILVEDQGVGIADISAAMQPMFTTKPTLERTGMGFSFMEAFMDSVEVESVLGQGTRVTLKKKIGVTETASNQGESS